MKSYFLKPNERSIPCLRIGGPYRRGEEQLRISSAREQIADVSIVDETDTYLNVGGILYSFVSLKELRMRPFPES